MFLTQILDLEQQEDGGIEHSYNLMDHLIINLDLLNENPPQDLYESGIANRGPAIQFRPQSNYGAIPYDPLNPANPTFSQSQFYVAPFTDLTNFNYYNSYDLVDPSGVDLRRNIFIRADNKQPFFNPNGLEELTKKNSQLQVPNLNVTSPDTFFNVTIGSEYCNPLPGFAASGLIPGPVPPTPTGQKIPGKEAPNKFTGAGSLTVAQNNWAPELKWQNITPGGGSSNPFDGDQPPNDQYPPPYDPNLPFYNKWNGTNFPADSKFSKVADNLRLTNTTHVFNKPQEGPRSSLTFYAYNIPDWRNDTNKPVYPDDWGGAPPNDPPPSRWFNGGIPNTNAPYNSVPAGTATNPTYSHTVGGAAIVLEPSGNSIINSRRTIDPADQRAGRKIPYELNFYIRSGNTMTPGILPPNAPNNDWVELDEKQEKPIQTYTNDRLIIHRAPTLWETNWRPQYGPTILDTQAEPGPAGGYRKAIFSGRKMFLLVLLVHMVPHMMLWQMLMMVILWFGTKLGMVVLVRGLINLLLQSALELCNMNIN